MTSSAAAYEVAAKVAAELGDRASPQHAEDGAVIAIASTAGEARLSVDFAWRDPARLVVTGIYPVTHLERLHHAEITVRTDRGTAVIAREVSRRLLPGYLAELGRVRETIARDERDAAARQAIGGQVTALFPADSFTRVTGYHGHGTEAVFHAGNGSSGTVRMSGNPSAVGLDLHGVPAAVALRMLAVLAAEVPAG